MAFRSPNPTIPEQRSDVLWWFCQEYLKGSVPLIAAKVCVQVVKFYDCFG